MGQTSCLPIAAAPKAPRERFPLRRHAPSQRVVERGLPALFRCSTVITTTEHIINDNQEDPLWNSGRSVGRYHILLLGLVGRAGRSIQRTGARRGQGERKGVDAGRNQQVGSAAPHPGDTRSDEAVPGRLKGSHSPHPQGQRARCTGWAEWAGLRPGDEVLIPMPSGEHGRRTLQGKPRWQTPLV